MIEIKGLNELNKKLKNLSSLKTGEILLSIANSVKNEINLSFENEKSPFGQDWDDLRPATLKDKAKKGFSGRKKLYRSGDLMLNWTITKKSDNEVIVSNNAESNDFKYGLVHQYGSNNAGRGRKTKIHARPFLPINKNKISTPLKNAIANAKKKLLKLV